MIKLSSIIKTGRFGDLGTQPDRDQLLHHLNGVDQAPTIVTCGSLEFHFNKKSKGLSLVHAERFGDWGAIELDVALYQGMSELEVESILNRLGVAYETSRRLDARVIATVLGVEFWFHDGLYSFSISTSSGESAQKQISITVTEREYGMLKELALGHRVSIAHLAAEMVRKGLT